MQKVKDLVNSSCPWHQNKFIFYILKEASSSYKEIKNKEFYNEFLCIKIENNCNELQKNEILLCKKGVNKKIEGLKSELSSAKD